MAPLSHPKMRIETVAVVFVGIFLLIGGCSKRPENHITVTGAFVFEDGTPLTRIQGLVRFSPVERTSRAPDYAELTPNGRFQLWSYVEDGSSTFAVADRGDGVPDRQILNRYPRPSPRRDSIYNLVPDIYNLVPDRSVHKRADQSPHIGFQRIPTSIARS